MKLSVYLLSGIAALALPGVGMAQNAQPAQTAASSGASAAGQDQTPDIVVTGRPAGSGIRKLEAGYSVTTLSAQQIDVQNPKSTGDVLKSVPGVWVESSGGVGTSNIFVRGIPSTGDAPFVTVSINSSPVYGATGLSFLDQTALFRLDDTVANVENVQGGPAALFSDGEPGLTTNFLLREGHEHTEGDIKLTATDYGQRRIDGFISGKLADDLYYMMGGYVATGDSVRTANFDTEKGGQFTASITKKFSDGKLNVYARYTDDHGEWFLPFATAVPGINPGTYNAMNNYTRFQTIIVPGSAGSGATERVDLGSGRGWKGVVAGGNFNKDLGSGFSVADHFSYTNGTLQTTGLVPAGAGAITVATALASGNGTPGQTTVQTVDTGRTLASTDYVQQLGGWVVEKDLRSITNDLALNYDFSGHKLTAGYYFSHFSSDDAWSLGNTRWVSIGGEGDLVNLNNGTLGAFAISEFGTADENAIYLADSYNITEQLRLDAAIRYQDEKLHLIVLGNGTPNSLDDDRHSVPWTLGLNYRATHSFDIYIRASRGYHIPGFDDLRSQIGQLGTPAATSAPLDQNWSIQSYEGGLKYHQRGLDLALVGFYDKVNGAVYNDVGVPPVLAGSKTYGLEFDGSWTSSVGFGINANADLEHARTSDPLDPNFDGKWAERIPSYYVRVTPNYKFGTHETNAMVFATYEAIGKRYSDLANTQVLPAYATLSAGLQAEYQGFSFMVVGDNLTNSQGLTEGNPRFLAGPGVALPDNRPIFGRSFRFTVGYKF